jgi:predicted ATPase
VQPELVAHHYTEAGLAEPAVRYWLLAAQRAARASANLEAADHARRGVSLIAELPLGRDRDLAELELQTTLAGVSVAVRGYSAPDVEQAYSRARELCQPIGRTPQLFLALWGLFSYYLVRGQLDDAEAMGRELEALAESLSDPSILLTAHVALGVARFYKGRRRAPSATAREYGT